MSYIVRWYEDIHIWHEKVCATQEQAAAMAAWLKQNADVYRISVREHREEAS